VDLHLHRVHFLVVIVFVLKISCVHCNDFVPVPYTYIVQHHYHRSQYYFLAGMESKVTKKFPNPVYFVTPLKGFPWNWVSVQGLKKLE